MSRDNKPRGPRQPTFLSVSKFTTKINIPPVCRGTCACVCVCVFVETFQDQTIPPLNIITTLLNYIKLTNASLPVLEATPSSVLRFRVPSASRVPVATLAWGRLDARIDVSSRYKLAENELSNLNIEFDQLSIGHADLSHTCHENVQKFATSCS